MKKMILLTFITLVSIFPLANAQEDIQTNDKAVSYLSYCSHFGSGVSPSFQSCINSNFGSISRAVGGFYSYCMNIGQEVDYGFTSCVNSGFREAQRQLGNGVYMQTCMNFDRKTLDFGFVSCVNSNFSAIERAISGQ